MKFLKSKLSLLIVPLLALILVAFFGCTTFQDVVTPCYIDPEAIDYTGQDANDVKAWLPFTSLWDAKRLARKMDRTTSENQKQLTRMIIDDADVHAYLSSNHLNYIQDAEEFRQTVFSPSGPIGMAIPALTAFGLGAFAISKPKDKRKIVELEKAPMK